MKKKFITAIAILMTLAACMTGCRGGKPSMSMEIIDEKSAQIVLNNADPDDFMLSGTIEIENGESLEITPEIKDGSEVSIELLEVSENQSPDKAPEIGEADFDVIINSNDMISSVVDPGSYMLKVTALSRSDGTISMEVQSAEITEEMTEDMDEADALVPAGDDVVGSEDGEAQN